MKRMTSFSTHPHYHEDSGDLLGFVARDSTGWQAQTIFGYTITRTTSEKAAKQALDEQGSQFLKGVWQYLDNDDHDWHSCVIVKAHESQVVVNRTNVLGFQEPSNFKQVVIEDPSETNLVKSQ